MDESSMEHHMGAFMKAMQLTIKPGNTVGNGDKSEDKESSKETTPTKSQDSPIQNDVTPMKIKEEAIENYGSRDTTPSTNDDFAECRVPTNRRSFKCSVKSCTNTDTSIDGHEKPMAFFRPPKNRKIANQWNKAIPDIAGALSMFHRVCASHFSEGQPTFANPVPTMNLDSLSESKPKVKRGEKAENSPRLGRPRRISKVRSGNDVFPSEVDIHHKRSELYLDPDSTTNEETVDEKPSPTSLVDKLGYDTKRTLITQTVPVTDAPNDSEIFGSGERTLNMDYKEMQATLNFDAHDMPFAHQPDLSSLFGVKTEGSEVREVIRPNNIPVTKKRAAPKKCNTIANSKTMCTKCSTTLPFVRTTVGSMEAKVNDMISMMKQITRLQKAVAIMKRRRVDVMRPGLVRNPMDNMSHASLYSPRIMQRGHDDHLAQVHPTLMSGFQRARIQADRSNKIIMSDSGLQELFPNGRSGTGRPVQFIPLNNGTGSRQHTLPVMKKPEGLNKYKIVKMPDERKIVLKPVSKGKDVDQDMVIKSTLMSSTNPGKFVNLPSKIMIKRSKVKEVVVKEEPLDEEDTVSYVPETPEGSEGFHTSVVESTRLPMEITEELVEEDTPTETEETGSNKSVDHMDKPDRLYEMPHLDSLSVSLTGREPVELSGLSDTATGSKRVPRIRKRKSDDMFVTTSLKKKTNRRRLTDGNVKESLIEETSDEAATQNLTSETPDSESTSASASNGIIKHVESNGKKDYLMNAVARVMLMFPGCGFTMDSLLQFGPIWLNKFPNDRLKSVVDNLVEQGLLISIGLIESDQPESQAFAKVDYDKMRTNPILKTALRNFGCTVEGFKGAFCTGANKQIVVLDKKIRAMIGGAVRIL